MQTNINIIRSVNIYQKLCMPVKIATRFGWNLNDSFFEQADCNP